MKTIEFKSGDFAWIGGWVRKGSWWVRYALVQGGTIPSVETIGYSMLDDGTPATHDSHEEAKEYEESKLLEKLSPWLLNELGA